MMSTRHRLAAAVGLTAAAAVALAAMALAQQPGFTGLFNARGTIDPVTIRDRDSGVKIRLRERTDVAIVGAQIFAGGQTGWHTHPAESIVSVKPGAPPLEMLTHRHGECVSREFKAGDSFVHPAGPHNFVNNDTEKPLDFGVAYFVPVGTDLLTAYPAPKGCPPGDKE